MEFEYALLIGVMSMKRFVLSFATAFMIITSGASSMDGLALGVAQGLVPLLEPIVQETVVDGIKHLKGIVTGKKCALGCRELGAPYCKSETFMSACKGGCQSIYQVGGYELRIRFKVRKMEQKIGLWQTVSGREFKEERKQVQGREMRSQLRSILKRTLRAC